MRISERYARDDWLRIRERLPDGGALADAASDQRWSEAVDVMRDRIDTRFMRTASLLVAQERSGFVLLMLDSLLIEYLQRLRTDRLDEQGSRDLVTGFLRERERFRLDFGEGDHDRRDRRCPCVACDFYRSARSGIAHYGETKNDWRIRYGEPRLLQVADGARVIDRNRFHGLVEAEFADYYSELLQPPSAALRRTLMAALDGICGLRGPGVVRPERGGPQE